MSNPITRELRDLMREAWDQSGREEAGDRQERVEATFERFADKLERALKLADRRGVDWRGPRLIGIDTGFKS